MRELIPVETDSTIARDPASNAILSTDQAKLLNYKKQKKALQRKDDNINKLNEKIDQLEALVNSLITKIG